MHHFTCYMSILNCHTVGCHGLPSMVRNDSIPLAIYRPCQVRQPLYHRVLTRDGLPASISVKFIYASKTVRLIILHQPNSKMENEIRIQHFVSRAEIWENIHICSIWWPRKTAWMDCDLRTLNIDVVALHEKWLREWKTMIRMIESLACGIELIFIIRLSKNEGL